MKRFWIGLGFLLCLRAWAGTVTLAWDPSPDPSVAGYYIYASTNHLTDTNVHSAPIRVNAGTNNVISVNTTNAGRWFFVATAYDTNRIESDVSNEVSVNFAPPPTNFVVLVPQFIATLGTTNWQDLGFFRLKIGGP